MVAGAKPAFYKTDGTDFFEWVDDAQGTTRSTEWGTLCTAVHTFFLMVYYIDNGDYDNLYDRHG